MGLAKTYGNTDRSGSGWTAVIGLVQMMTFLVLLVQLWRAARGTRSSTQATRAVADEVVGALSFETRDASTIPDVDR